jgi:hypothetical protein
MLRVHAYHAVEDTDSMTLNSEVIGSKTMNHAEAVELQGVSGYGVAMLTKHRP